MTKIRILAIFVFILLTVIYGETAEQNVVINIEGMTCKLCPLAVKKSLLEVEAVKKAGPYKSKIIERKTEE
jgi:mercuric ion binding protein